MSNTRTSTTKIFDKISELRNNRHGTPHPRKDAINRNRVENINNPIFHVKPDSEEVILRRNTIIRQIASVINKILMLNAKREAPVNRFLSSAPCNIPIDEYMLRFASNGNFSEEVFIAMAIYLDRYVAETQLILHELNIHRLIITSILLVNKIHDDVSGNNEFFARIGGISAKELKVLEMDFLADINWNLQIPRDIYVQYNLEFQIMRERDFPTTSVSSRLTPG